MMNENQKSSLLRVLGGLKKTARSMRADGLKSRMAPKPVVEPEPLDQQLADGAGDGVEPEGNEGPEITIVIGAEPKEPLNTDEPSDDEVKKLLRMI